MTTALPVPDALRRPAALAGCPMKPIAHCPCRACKNDRLGRRIAWLLIAFAIIYIAVQIGRAAAS